MALKKRILVPLIGIGLAVGYGAVSLLWPTSPRVHRIVTLFTEVCIAHHRTPDTQPALLASLSPYDDDPSATVWIDETSASFVTLEPRRCKLETHHPFALSRRDALDLAKRIESIVERALPELPFDLKAKMGPISMGWLDGALQSSERWGVYFYASPYASDSAGSILSLASPRD